MREGLWRWKRENKAEIKWSSKKCGLRADWVGRGFWQANTQSLKRRNSGASKYLLKSDFWRLCFYCKSNTILFFFSAAAIPARKSRYTEHIVDVCEYVWVCMSARVCARVRETFRIRKWCPRALESKRAKGRRKGEVRFKCVLLRSTCERKEDSLASSTIRACEFSWVCGVAGDSRVPVRQACMRIRMKANKNSIGNLQIHDSKFFFWLDTAVKIELNGT